MARKIISKSSLINRKRGSEQAISWRTRFLDQLQKATESATMINALITSIGEGLIIVNEYGIIDHVNQPALDILDYEQHELEGKWFPAMLPIFDKLGNSIPDDERPAIRALLEGKPITELMYYQRKGGKIIPVSSTASPFMVRDKPKGAVVIFRDVSREAQIERAKDEFVSIASHQLRSPLTSIRLFTELLASSAKNRLTKKEHEYIKKILFSTEKMIDLATDYLNISRIELGQLVVTPRPTSLEELIEKRVEEMKPVAAANHVTLEYKSNLTKREEIPLDRDLVGQVIHNLLSNAIRYTGNQSKQKGLVTVNLKRTRKYYDITVADNGIGIPQRARSRIFERFYRADNAVRIESEGSGLGLYLVKKIIEGTGGKISYKSRENKGTAFTICIPLKGME